MKTNGIGIWYLGGLLLMIGLEASVCHASNVPPCTPTTNWYDAWSCSSGSISNVGVVTPSNAVICVGDSASASVSGTTFNNGSKSRTGHNDCGDSWTDGPYSYGYSATNWFEPEIPTNFPTCGIYSYTAKVEGISSDSDCTGSVGPQTAGTFTVYVVQLNSLDVSGATAVGTNGDYAAIKTTNNDYVTITANICPNDTNAAAKLSWSGGDADPDNPLARRVSKTTAAKTTVTASCCNTSITVNVWIVWADLTCKVSGTLDPDDKASLLDNGNFPTPQSTSWGGLGVGGGNTLGVVDSYNNTNINYHGVTTIGRMEAKAVLLPTGIGNLITNGWKMKRNVAAIGWDNGGSPTLDTGGTIPPSYIADTTVPEAQYLNPINDDIFDLDFPAVGVASHTADSYDNFYEYVTVNFSGADETCSDMATYSYEAQVDGDAARVDLNVLGSSHISLPSSSHYSTR